MTQSELYEYSGLGIRRECYLRAVELEAKGAGLSALARALSCAELTLLHDIKLFLPSSSS
jgi:hypothetical protein